MGFVSKRFFLHKISVEKYIGTDAYGVDTFEAPVILDARQEERNEEQSQDDRWVLLQRAIVYFYGDPSELTLNSRVTLLDGPVFPILQVFKQRGPKMEVLYVRVIVGRTSGD